MHGLGMWLLKNGHDPLVLASHTEASEYEIEGLPYRTVKAKNRKWLNKELTPAVTMIPAMARALRKIKPDLVHCYSYHDAEAARLARVPYLISYAGIILPASWDKAPRQYKIFKRASKHARAIYCPTRACGDSFKNFYDIDYELLAYGIRVKDWAPTVATIPGRIMTAATANDIRKRPEFLVKAFGIVAEQNADAHLVFCAAADDETQLWLRNMVPKHARDRLFFRGDISRESLRKEYARAKVSALVSVNEAFGLVQLESLAAGTPVVAARSGAVPEVLTSRTTGRMFEPDDVDGCAEQLLWFLNNNSRTLSQRCIEHAEQYDYEVIGPQTVELYERVTASRSRRRRGKTGS